MGVQVCEGRFDIGDQQTLFYTSKGSGLPVVFCNGIGVSSQSFWPHVSVPLSERMQTIHWDYLGHGFSDQPSDPSTLTIASFAEHLVQLLDALEIPQAVIAGHSMGAQVGFEFYKRYPERVLALIPTLGTYEHPFDNFLRFSKSADIFEHVSQQVLRFPEVISKVWPHLFYSRLAQRFARVTKFIHPTLCSRDELDVYLSHLKRFSPESFFYLARNMQNHSASDVLDTIDVPTLVIAGERDLFTPIEASFEMHRQIPNAELLVVKEGSHAALAEQSELFWLRIERFLSTHFMEQLKQIQPVQMRS